jgi:Rieske Fe-S protein
MGSTEREELSMVESRRSFLGRCGQALAGITIVGVAAPLFQACETSKVLGSNNNNNGDATITVDVKSLDADNKALVTTQTGPDGKNILVVRQSATSYLALSMECQHQLCPVNPPQNGFIDCPCHGSRYDMTGAVVNGPTTKPLKRYPLTFDATAQTVTITIG